jgi:hypothetical protein
MSERLLIPPALPQSGLHKNLALRWLALATVLVACEGVAAGPLGDPLPGAQLDRPARSAPVRIADADREPNGVQLTTASTNALLKQGDVIVNVLEVHGAVAGQKIRIQNSNHGASSFTTSFSAAVKAAIADIPGVTFTQITEQQMEIVLVAGSYRLPISQTVTDQIIPIGIDDANWAPGPQPRDNLVRHVVKHKIRITGAHHQHQMMLSASGKDLAEQQSARWPTTG